MTIKMYYAHDTLRKVVYEEDVENPKLGSLYMSKEVYEELGCPGQITVDIKAKGEK